MPLAKAFPAARECYLKENDVYGLELGTIQGATNKDYPNVIVFNMIAQTLGGKRPLYYNHLARCMDKISDYLGRGINKEIHAPAFGSGLAGGRWDVIMELIEDCWLRRNLSVTIHYLPGQHPCNVKR